MWRQDTSKAARLRAKLSCRGSRCALEGLVVQHLIVARIAEGLDVSWSTANDPVLAEGKRVLINDPNRFSGVKVIGVDEHAWRDTRKGDKYVNAIIDLTPDPGRRRGPRGWTWSPADPSRRSRPGWMSASRPGARPWRWSR